MKIAFSNLLLLALCFYTSCDLGLPKEDEPKTELEKLPPITTTGKNTFGCLVNGKAFVVNSASDMSAIYQGGGVQISAALDHNNVDQNVLLIAMDPLEINKNYDLQNLPYYKARFKNTTGGAVCWYEYQDTYTGNLTFINIDRTNYIISGTFEFSTTSQNCDTITVTEGRFDMRYIP